MDNKTILNFKTNDVDKLGMILSNNIDRGSSDGGLISVNAFEKLIADLIEWKYSVTHTNLYSENPKLLEE